MMKRHEWLKRILPSVLWPVLWLVAGLGTGCSTLRTQTAATPTTPAAPETATVTPEAAPPIAVEQTGATPADSNRVQTLQKTVEQLTEKIDQLETRITSLNDIVKAQTVAPPSEKSTKIPTTAVSTPLAMEKEISESARVSVQGDGEPIQRFRKALVLFDASRWSDSVIEFSTFLRDFADHSMAGAAQFYLGESYFKQNEYRLASDEFQRVLVSYDSSSFVPDSLLRLVQCQEKLRLKEDAAKTRQLLLALFPQSPAARQLTPWSVETAPSDPETKGTSGT